MHNKPKVSICMITYGHENYIREAVNSILMQLISFDLELVIANDCSPDDTDTVINNIIKSHPKGRLIKYLKHEDNIGMMSNGIFALQQCQGKYIAMCEGDDYWTDPLKLQKQVDFMEENPDYAGCFHNTEIINEMESNPQLKPWRTYTKNDFTLRDTLSTTSLLHTSSFMFRTAALLIPSWLKEVQSGDMALFTIIASQGPLYRINDSMSVYRKNESGVTNNVNGKEYHSHRIKLFYYFKQFLKGAEEDQIKNVINFHKSSLKKLKKNSFKNRIKAIFRI